MTKGYLPGSPSIPVCFVPTNLPRYLMANQKLLVANRGEIALRILRTASQLAIPTLAVYSAHDGTTSHASKADQALHVESYTDGAALIALALEAGATILHPGYGFLSEDAEFAASVEAAGITWLGPRSAEILAMGLKHEARTSATEAGVPVLPGGELVPTLAEALASATQVGYPVMLKATGGGGGMGMVVCEDADELETSYESTVKMTKSLFFNGGVFIEKFIPRARHIEVQVFGDGEGNVIHLGERECSVQRRHQKVLEEAPSPFIRRHPEVGEAMCAAAVRLCERISYRSAGTVEFLVDDTTGRFYFLELNSRIQVEHAVTESVRPGLDIVALMINLGLSHRLGRPFLLPSQASMTPAYGHAIEARIYAEIPHLQFKPAPGLLQLVEFPSHPWLRIDTWVETGSRVSPFYDPMIAKLIAHGSTRDEARARLAEALATTKIHGTPSNVAYLSAIVDCQAFRHGDVTTSFLDTFAYSASCIEVLDEGLSTTIQDLRPRICPSGDGIPPGGAMDELAFRCANTLAGNSTEVEAIEITLTGPSFRFDSAAVVGIAGAACEVFLDGELKPMWSRIIVPAGSTLEFGACEEAGARVYLAIRGGFPEIPLYLDSKSTFTSGQFGGYQGRDLAAGDLIVLSPSSLPLPGEQDLVLPTSLQVQYPHEWKLAAFPGPHADADYLTPQDRHKLFSTTYAVSADSNRLGIRLEGLGPLQWSRKDGGAGGGHPSNTIEHGYTLGSLNLNGDTPVLFTVDGPDCGGFVCVLTVASPDHWKFGQIRPGDKLRFEETTADTVSKQQANQAAWFERVADFVKFGTSAGDESPLPIDLPVDANLAPQDGVLLFVPEDSSQFQPSLSYRQAGDACVLIEIGPQIISFAIRLFSELWERRIRALELPGLRSIIQGASTITLRFDPLLLSSGRVVEALSAASLGLGLASQDMAIPTRRVHMPMVFEDSTGLAAIKAHMVSSGRKAGMYLPSNIDYIAAASGLPDSASVLARFLSSDWYVSSRAFFCGLPLMLPIDQRACIAGQKYNPSRTFTPGGTLGYAGCTSAIYPVDSPGGYQIIGRTLTPWSLWADSYEGHFLLRNFDLIKWIPMSEDEFTEVERLYKKNEYTVRIEDVVLSAQEIAAIEAAAAPEVARNNRVYAENMARLGLEEAKHLEDWQADKAKEAAALAASSSGARGSQSGTPLKCPLLAVVRSLVVQIGDVLQKDTVVAKVEAMKTEIAIKVPRSCVGKTVSAVAVEVGDLMQAGQPLFFCN